ncbi:aBC-type sugar transport system periplasmic component [Coprococcus sp. CAG:782]|nr:aBC-type sugar transport system periplasmic component [Coprococcus sp. CAG:782]
MDMKSELEVQYFYSIKEDAIVGMEENTANADYEYMLWGNDEGAVYTPNTIFAINNKEDNRDNGIRFVKDMFGVDVQKMYYGIDVANPVNIDGIRASNEMALEMGTPGGGIKVGENQYLDWSYWRTDEYLEDYIDKLRQLKVPSNTDARIRNMIRDNMADYLEGGVSLDDTMDAVDSALSVYLSE